MAHPIYRNKEGERIPSVTTILSSIGWGKDAISWWAWNEGIHGRDYKVTMNTAAKIGTVVHMIVEAYCKGEKLTVDELKLDAEIDGPVRNCVKAWETWLADTKLKFIASEVSLVSELYQYGGTLDCAAMNDVVSILDIKTGSEKAVDSNLVQVVAYGNLWNENNQNKIEQYHLLYLNKESGNPTHKSFMANSDPVDQAWKCFLSAKEIYKNKPKIK